MRKFLVFLIGLVFVGFVAFQFINSYYSLGNRSEKNIESYVLKSESVLSNFSTSIAELTQVTGKYKQDLIEVIKTSLQGRYGDDGSKAVFQFLQEQNLNLDSNLYLNIQNRLISGRQEFKNSQEMIVDACKQYKIELDGLISGAMLRLFGYPKMDMDSCKVISDEKTRETFKTKTQQPLTIN